ncbi:mediator of RNA polymerase II transcription subunit 26-like protein, partial [Trifolium pratense]
RLLPYHVVADYEAEEDDRILDSDTTGQMLSRSQQWDNNIAAKIAEFTATFEKQALAFNIISQKRSLGEFRSEERLMIEQALLQEERRAMVELRAEIESREKAGREAHEAKLRMAAMYQADQQARADSQSHAEMMSRAPIRGSALGSQGSDIGIGGHDMGDQDHGEMMNGWGNNAQRDEKEPSEDFLNDEAENGDTDTPEGWREAGEFDLNARTAEEWQQPRFGHVKCNVDASFYDAAGVTGWGWCVRDHRGRFIVAGTNIMQARLNTLEGEAMAIKEAIGEMLQRGFSHVIFESDSKIVVDF